MEQQELQTMATFLAENMRLRTLPVAVAFLRERSAFPPKTREPHAVLGKRITVCQAMTMARLYGWTVGLTREDLICVPAMIVFGFGNTNEPQEALGRLFCEIDFAGSREGAAAEIAAMARLERDEYEAIVLSPLQKGLYDPDTVVVYGNPAQMARLAQALAYGLERRIAGSFGGKVECSEYLIAPFKTGEPRMSIPGNGDRIFSMTQDDEMALALPGKHLSQLIRGLKESGRKIGARYPVTFYQNFQPEFPGAHKELGKELGIL